MIPGALPQAILFRPFGAFGELILFDLIGNDSIKDDVPMMRDVRPDALNAWHQLSPERA